MKPYYDEGGITIYHADCRDVISDIDPDMVDLLLTDPPYGIDWNTNMSRFNHRAQHQPGFQHRHHGPVHGDGKGFNPANLLSQFDRLFLFGANYYSTLLPEGQWFVWDKRDGLASNVLADAELAWHNLGGRSVSLFSHRWYWGIRDSERHTAYHPTQKPVSLMKWILEQWTDTDDLVVDPYMGSGPIAQACHEMGRRYVGVEIVEEYCETAVGRLAQQVLAV